MRSWLVIVVSALLSCAPPPQVVSDDLTDLPLSGLDESWLERFAAGDQLFEVPFTPIDGLGPLSIRQACAACHESGGRGPGFVEKVVQVDERGVPVPGQPALPYGHTLRPQRSAGATRGLEPDSSVRLLKTRRVGPTVWAAGALEAVDEAELSRLERSQAARTDGVSGRVNHVTYASERSADEAFHRSRKGDRVVGRFGVKARVGYLDDFAADAFQGDMGLTSALRPVEPPNPDGLVDDLKPGVDLDVGQIAAVADYLRLLRLPARREGPPAGRRAFERAGCDVCHVPSLRTRRDYPVPVLADVDVALFTDILLHDMGPTFADGLDEADASATEFKTAPLVGVRFLRSFLHDGRATSVEDAILLHGGEGSEAKGSVDAFRAMDEPERRALLEFLRAQ